MTRIALTTLSIVSAFLALAAAAGAQDAPKFSQFAERVYAGPHSPVNLVTKDDHAFATRLKQAGAQKVNFGGHYILSTWGCGAECLGGALIDVRNGKVTFLPYSVCCWGEGDPLYFRTDSRLIVLSGVLNEESPRGAHFFEFRDDVFVHLTSRTRDGAAIPGIPRSMK
jgi:hypothetical protein